MICLLISALAHLILLESVIWGAAAILVPDLASIQQPAVLVLLGGVFAAADHLFLQKARNMLLVSVVNLVFALTAALISGSGHPFEVCCHLFLLGLTFFFLIRKGMKGLQDSTLTIQFQAMAAAAAWQIWIGGQLDLSLPWIPWTFAGMALLILAMINSKTSGLRSSDTGSGKISALAVFLLLGTAGVLAVFLAEHAGHAAEKTILFFAGGAEIILTGMVRLLQMLPKGKGGGTAVDAPDILQQMTGGEEGMGMTGGGAAQVILLLLIICMAGGAVFGLIHLIRHLAGRRTEVPVKAMTGSLKLVNLHIGRSLKGYWVLLRHPNSIAALLVRLERQCARKRGLRRRRDETVREFLIRLADQTDASRTEGADALRRLAEGADFACYGKEGRLLEPWEDSETIRNLRF